MGLLEQQLAMSQAMATDQKIEAGTLGLGESRLINFPRVETERSGYYEDYQYPDNRGGRIDGQGIVQSESGLEKINNSKTAGQLG